METAGREVYVQSRAMGQPSVTDGLSPSVLSYLRVSISLNWTDFLGLCRLLSDAIVFDSLLISLLISILALDEELEKLSNRVVTVLLWKMRKHCVGFVTWWRWLRVGEDPGLLQCSVLPLCDDANTP
eukprot:scaffold10241_cov256-Chaetoceros_neogracile.AAC.11